MTCSPPILSSDVSDRVWHRHVDVFNSNGEVYENACDLPPAAETVVAVTRAVTLDEESRDVRAGVLRYLIS